MIVELGHFCLVIACVLAGLQMVLPSVGLFRGNFLLINTGRSLASGVFFVHSLKLLCVDLCLFDE